MKNFKNPSSFSVDKDSYLKIGIIILIVFIICLIVLLALGFASLYTEFENSTDNSTLSWLGGAIGGLVSIVLALFTFLAFYVQYQANLEIQEQNKKIQKRSNEEAANELFFKMIDLHKANIDEFKIKSYDDELVNTKETHTHGNFNATIKSVEIETFRLKEYFTVGRRCFVLMLNDFHYCAEVSFLTRRRLGFLLSDELTMMLAYRIFFWGSNSQHIYPPNLCRNQRIECKHIAFEIERLKKEQRANKGKPKKFSYTTDDQKFNNKSAKFILASGHSTRLAHYYRQLWQTVKHIHHTSEFKCDEFLRKPNIDTRFKALRAQMTNEEQLLLYYNYRYGFGGRWDYRYDDPKQGTSEFRFLTKYLMLHNVPLYDTLHNKAENPIDHFRTYKIKFTNADLFEWGGY